MTPAIVLGTVLNALRVSLPWEGLWYFVLSIGYFVFGLRSASSGPLPAVASSTAPGPSRRRSGVPPPRKS
jgi:hypothetical protein